MEYRAIAMALLLAAPVSLQAQDGAPSLEQRVERIEAESAIRRVLIEYGKFLDAKDYHAYAGLFAKDGVWQGGFGTFAGPAAIEKMLVDNMGAPGPGFVNKANFHMLTNPVIAIDGDRAQVEFEVPVLDPLGRRPSDTAARRALCRRIRARERAMEDRPPHHLGCDPLPRSERCRRPLVEGRPPLRRRSRPSNACARRRTRWRSNG